MPLLRSLRCQIRGQRNLFHGGETSPTRSTSQRNSGSPPQQDDVPEGRPDGVCQNPHNAHGCEGSKADTARLKLQPHAYSLQVLGPLSAPLQVSLLPLRHREDLLTCRVVGEMELNHVCQAPAVWQPGLQRVPRQKMELLPTLPPLLTERLLLEGYLQLLLQAPSRLVTPGEGGSPAGACTA